MYLFIEKSHNHGNTLHRMDDTPSTWSRNIIIGSLLNAMCFCIQLQYTKQWTMEFTQFNGNIYNLSRTDRFRKICQQSINLVCRYITQYFIPSIHNILISEIISYTSLARPFIREGQYSRSCKIWLKWVKCNNWGNGHVRKVKGTYR